MSAPSERDVQALARRIAEAGGEEKTRLFRGSWWSEQLLGWAMAKGAFKTQLFRFVDVFPGCRDDDDVMRHLREYFDGGATPAPLRLGLASAARSRSGPACRPPPPGATSTAWPASSSPGRRPPRPCRGWRSCGGPARRRPSIS